MLIAGTLFLCKHPLCYLAARYKLETRRKNNRLGLLHKINTSHVDITLDLYLQRSDPRTRGAQRFRYARADHPALHHSFFPATLRQWNRLLWNKPISHHMPRGFQSWPSCLNICFNSFINHNNTFFKSPEVHRITLLTFYFLYNCLREHTPKRTRFN